MGTKLSNHLFDELAKKYDTKERIALARIIQKEVEKELEEAQNKVLLDYGSGTGLVSLDLAASVEYLYLVDSSKEMTAITDRKISRQGLINAEAICHDLLESNLELPADIILVSLVLLHIPDTNHILKRLYQQLSPKGKLIIVDFDLNERVKDSRIHSGFDKQLLKDQLKEVGFLHLSSDTFYTGEQLFMKEDASLCLTLGYK